MSVPPEMIADKARIEAEILARPGVSGVDIGYKEVGGEKTDILAIRVLVERKRPEREVPEDELIPSELAGYPTDVIERVFRPCVTNPLVGGASIGPCRTNFHAPDTGSVVAGTLGCVVYRNAGGAPALLSCFHVLGHDFSWNVGDQMASPSLSDGGSCPTDICGSLITGVIGGVDCAIADVLPNLTPATAITSIGQIKGTATVTLGEALVKTGRTTGLTTGTVDAVALSTSINYGNELGTLAFTNQIGVTSGGTLATSGDSGSVFVDSSYRVVGLLFAISGNSYAIANPIASVLSALNVSMFGPPINYYSPIITGTAAVGATLTCSTGYWSISSTVVLDPQITSYAYQWIRDGADIPGATGNTRVVDGDDDGHTLTCRVRATNAAGFADHTSAGRLIPAVGPGTITQGGLYTAPASIPSPPTVTVTFVSSTGAIATATVTVT